MRQGTAREVKSITAIIADGLDACVDSKRGWNGEHMRASRLADAAPELLEALKEYDEAVRNKIGIIPELRASYAKVVAAIAKAEGRD